MNEDSRANELMNYSFLVVFANDDTISEGELHMIERLALKDNTVDEDEKRIIGEIFDRANSDHMTEEVRLEIQLFRKEFGI